MGALVRGGIDAWSTSGAAKALTTSYVAGTAFDSEDADELWVSMITSATVTTSTDIRVVWSDDGGSEYFEVPAIGSVSSAGVVSADDLSVEHAGGAANGNHSFGPFAIPSNCKIRVDAKRTGGDATSALIAKATIIRST